MDDMDKKYIHDLTYKLMIDLGGRNVAFDAYMSMYKGGWDLPPSIRNLPWVTKVINSDPFDAIQTGIRILATIPMSIRFQPLLPGEANKDRAETIERVLKWQFMQANRRRSKTIEAELAKQALLFDLCGAKVIDVDWELERRKDIGGETRRLKAWREHGRLRVIPYDARSVFPLWSNGMLEGVLIVQHRRAMDVLKEWGGRASQYDDLVKLSTANYGRDWVTYYEWQDYNNTMVWARPGQQWTYPASFGDAEHWLLDAGASPTPFLPWAILGGSELEDDPAHRHIPLLYPVWITGAWDTKNIVQSLGVSETVAHTGAPRFVEEGPNQQQADVDYGRPERIAKMSPGNTLKPVPAPAVDQALQNVEALLSAQIDKATVSRILQGGELAPGTAFATLNLQTQTAVGVLSPFKDLTQKTLAEIATIMLKWVAHTNKDLWGYGTEGEVEGEQLVINSDELSPEDIYINVDLHPDTATDKQQKVNTAAIAVQQLGMSKMTALEEIGIEDAKQELKRGMMEQFIQHELDMIFQQEMLSMQTQIQMQAEAQSMEMQMAMQQNVAQQEQPMGAGEMMGGELAPGNPTGGQGFNPAAGGQPPAGASPLGQAAGAGNPEQQIGEMQGGFE